MFKLTSFILVTVAVNLGDSAVFRLPVNQNSLYEQIIPSKDLESKWGQHIMDFLNLMDIDEVMGVVMQYIQDPEMIEFIQFLTSPKIAELVKEFESIEEFMEAIEYMESEGYEAKYIVNVINSFMKIPPLGKQMLERNKGLSGFFEDIMAIIPGDKMMELFESKLETSPEVAELYETFTSDEFLDIMKRLTMNPKFKKIIEMLEGYGFGPKFICNIAGKEIFGEFCK